MITPPRAQHPDVYVISLKSATARREGMERQAARLREAGYTGNVVFFEATDAARREHLAFPQYSPFWANVAGTPLTDGERACFACAALSSFFSFRRGGAAGVGNGRP